MDRLMNDEKVIRVSRSRWGQKNCNSFDKLKQSKQTFFLSFSSFIKCMSKSQFSPGGQYEVNKYMSVSVISSLVNHWASTLSGWLSIQLLWQFLIFIHKTWQICTGRIHIDGVLMFKAYGTQNAFPIKWFYEFRQPLFYKIFTMNLIKIIFTLIMKGTMWLRILIM